MAKNEQILRLKYIETLLRNRKERGASYEEIEEYLQKKFAENDTLEELKFSKKTWERDQLAISEIISLPPFMQNFYPAHFLINSPRCTCGINQEYHI